MAGAPRPPRGVVRCLPRHCRALRDPPSLGLGWPNSAGLRQPSPAGQPALYDEPYAAHLRQWYAAVDGFVQRQISSPAQGIA